MSIKHYLPGLAISCFTFILLNCGEKKQNAEQTTFTKSDSLTETYLALQDSMLHVWNMMVSDDNQKIKAMHNLTHELMISGKSESDELVSIEQRLEQLNTLRYDQKTMADGDVVEEYDFATSSLISELLSIAESRPELADNTTLQKFVEKIKLTDQRVIAYREEYDDIVMKYNLFLDTNEAGLKEIDPMTPLEKKPVFGMSLEE